MSHTLCATCILVLCSLAGLEHSSGAEVTSLRPSNGPTMGVTDIHLLGKELGDVDLEPMARISGTACSQTTWRSSSSVVCRMSALGVVGADRKIELTVRQFQGADVKSFVLEATPRFSFDQVAVSSVRPGNAPVTTDLNALPLSASGYSRLEVIGSSFSPVDYSMRARLGGTACQSTRWIADTALTCQSGPSVQQALEIGVTLSRLHVSMTRAFSYDRPTLAQVAPQNGAAKGGDPMTVMGDGFGVSDSTLRARLHMDAGDFACVRTAWTSDSSLTCVLPAGVDVGVNIAVTTNRNVKTAFKVFSYDACVITGLAPANMPSSGAAFTVHGLNFGRQDAMGARNVRIGDTACMAPVWTSDSVLACKSMAGLGHRLRAAVSVAGAVNMLSAAASYDAPVVRKLGISNSPASGNVVLFIEGKSFGAYELTPLVRTGDTLCSYTRWINDETLHCLMPRASVDGAASRFFAGSSEHVRLGVANLHSLKGNAISYDQSCLGPCVGSLGCDMRHGASQGMASRGCAGPTSGDFRHVLNAKRVQFGETDGESVVRIHGNFSVSGSAPVVVGNSTHNTTVAVKERLYRYDDREQGDVSVTFGDLYDCQIIEPAPGDDSSLQQYLDCILPPGVGTHHRVKVCVCVCVCVCMCVYRPRIDLHRPRIDLG